MNARMQRFLGGLAGLVAAASFLAGAVYYRTHKITPDREPVEMTTNVKVFVDPDTGCHYLVRLGYVTPRLSGDGRQLCIL